MKTTNKILVIIFSPVILTGCTIIVILAIFAIAIMLAWDVGDDVLKTIFN